MKAMEKARHKWRTFSTDENGVCFEAPDEVYKNGWNDAIKFVTEELRKEPFMYSCEGGVSGDEWASLIELEFNTDKCYNRE